VAFTDPFGLKVCFTGNAVDRQQAQQAAEQATNSTITLEENSSCVKSFTPRGDKKYRKLQQRFKRLVESRDTLNVTMTDEVGSRTSGSTVLLSWRQLFSRYVTCPDHGIDRWDAGAIFTHEALGHGTQGWFRNLVSEWDWGKSWNQGRAIDIENEYHAAAGQGLRCPDPGVE
jgi:hypothetical protein